MNNEPDYDNLYFEEKKMQKTPEVGDVWINTKTNKKICITGLGNHVYVVSDSGIASSRWHCDFKNLYTYLGKSKANINDLFKTENEE